MVNTKRELENKEEQQVFFNRVLEDPENPLPKGIFADRLEEDGNPLDRTVFLKTIEEEPNNPLHHYVFADWLEEQGDPEWRTQRLLGNAVEYGLVKFSIGEEVWKRTSLLSDKYLLAKVQGFKVKMQTIERRGSDTTYGDLLDRAEVLYAIYGNSFDTIEKLLFREEEIQPKFHVGEVVQHDYTTDCIVTRTIKNKEDKKIEFSYEVLYPGHTLNYVVESYFLSKRTDDGGS